MPAEVKAAVVGLAGTTLSPDEKALFADQQPLGIILFKRNIKGPKQVRDLIAACRELLTDADPLILIDQEGGRVARLGPPDWPSFPAAARFGVLAEYDLPAAARATELQGCLLAAELRALGFNVNCAPCLDLTHDETHAAIGDRSFSRDPHTVAVLGRALADGLLSGGVLPVIKHLPGHGRARIDSHLEMPEISTDAAVLQDSDFAPFRALSDLPLGMTGHLLFSKIDAKFSATISTTIIEKIIRRDIGFQGFLLSDDICMQALNGGPGERARATLAAGVDCALHCNGFISETADVLSTIGPLTEKARNRLAQARRATKTPTAIDVASLTAERDGLLKLRD